MSTVEKAPKKTKRELTPIERLMQKETPTEEEKTQLEQYKTNQPDAYQLLAANQAARVRILERAEKQEISTSLSPPKQDIIILSISGKIGSGKTTFANMLKQSFSTKTNFTCCDFSHAKILKRVVSAMTCEPIDLFDTDEGKNTYLPLYNKTIGELLQDV